MRRRASASGRSAPPATSRAGVEGRGVENDDAAGHTFTELSALLHDGRGNGYAQGRPAGLPVVTTPRLLTLLSDAQHQTDPSALPPGGRQLQNFIGTLVGSVSEGKEQFSQVDADVINLVSMLFDFILEDRQLPSIMKALLSRLQIPILKVALLDRSFFNRGGHPARKLLNELAMAAIGWNEKAEGQRDPLLDKVTAGCRTVAE